uniref:Pentacotripeptide-repeat region of PRORP domain-containing protein n=1 Tax=Leersia perrieri TaxID=77586 RepID=A0A0D9XNB7_9ORYZ
MESQEDGEVQNHELQKQPKEKKRKKERLLDFLRAAPSNAQLRQLLAGVSSPNRLPPLAVKLLHARILRLDLLAALSPLLLRALSSSALHLHALRLHCLLPTPSHLTFPIAFKSASRLPHPLRAGEQLHARSLKLPSHTNPHVLTSLLNLYSKCGLLRHAQRVFDEMSHPNTVSWTALITAYMDAGELKEAVRVARSAFADGMRPDSFTAVRVLTACARAVDLATGEMVWKAAEEEGIARSVFVATAAVDLYVKCGEMAKAREVFDKMQDKDAVAWGAMVGGYASNGHPREALELFLALQAQGVRPDCYAVVGALSACTRLGALDLGRQAITKLDWDQFLDNPVLGTALIDMYAKCGSTAEAWVVFQQMRKKDIIVWNAMILGLGMTGHEKIAFALVGQMEKSAMILNDNTFIGLLCSCTHTGLIQDGQRYFHNMTKLYHISPRIEHYGCMVDLLSRAGLLQEAHQLIVDMPMQANAVIWGALLGGCKIHRNPELAEHIPSDPLWKHTQASTVASLMGIEKKSPAAMQPTILPATQSATKSSSAQNFSLCSPPMRPISARSIFALVYRNGYTGNVLVANAVINMLSRFGLLDRAYGFFCSLTFRNIVTWNEMIAGYGLFGRSEDALRLFRSLVCFGERPDEFTYSAVLSAFQEAQGVRDHEQVHAIILKQGFASCQFVSTSLIKANAAAFRSVQSSLKIIEDTGKMDVVSWGVIMSAFLKHGLNDEVLFLFNLFRRDSTNKPDEFILATVLNASANDALIRHCRHEKHFCVASAVVDAYAKCGEITSAENAFSAVSSATDDAILYNTMLTAYANHGLIHEDLSLYEEMTKAQLNPTPATFVAVLSACSHLGLVEQGKLVFSSMLSAYGIHPARANYTCLVDLLARKGLLDEAKCVIDTMPFQPWPAVWRSLVNSCRIHGNKQLGVVAAEQILRMAPGSDGAYVSLANVYADDGEWQYSEETRNRMVQNQVQKLQGYSRIEV